MHSHVLVDAFLCLYALGGHESRRQYEEIDFGVFGENGRSCAFDVGYEGNVAGYEFVRSSAAETKLVILEVERLDGVHRWPTSIQEQSTSSWT
jgi:hypothetical protein